MRTRGAAIATATNWITNFIVVEITPIGVRTIGWRFYIIWTVFNASFLPLIWLIYPETADRTLEDLDAHYRDNPPLLVIKDKDSTSRKRPTKYALMQRQDVEDAAAELRRRRSAVGVPGSDGEKVTAAHSPLVGDHTKPT